MDVQTVTAILGAVGGTAGIGGLLTWWGSRGDRRADLSQKLTANAGRAVDEMEAGNRLLKWKVAQLLALLRSVLDRHERAERVDVGGVRQKALEVEIRDVL